MYLINIFIALGARTTFRKYMLVLQRLPLAYSLALFLGLNYVFSGTAFISFKNTNAARSKILEYFSGLE